MDFTYIDRGDRHTITSEYLKTICPASKQLVTTKNKGSDLLSRCRYIAFGVASSDWSLVMTGVIIRTKVYFVGGMDFHLV